MSQAYECDRCGELRSGVPAGHFVVATDKAGGWHHEWDLCSDCLGAVEEDMGVDAV